MKKFFGFVAAVAAAACVFCTASCRDTTARINSDCETGWKVTQYKAGDGTDAEMQTVYFQVSRGSDKVDEVWFNVGEMTVDEADIEISCYYSSDRTSITSSVTTAKLYKADAVSSGNGWVRVKDGYAQSYSTVRISLSGGVRLNEVVFLDTADKRLSVSINYADIIYRDADGTIKGGLFSEDELGEMESEDGTPAMLIDEQAKFDNK